MNQLNALPKTNLVNTLTSVNLSGTIEPCVNIFSEDHRPEYKLTSTQGVEYSLSASARMKETLAQSVWKEVEVMGILNKDHMILIPQQIRPKKSNGEKENIIQLDGYRRKNLLKKIARKVNELIIIPIGVLALLAS